LPQKTSNTKRTLQILLGADTGMQTKRPPTWLILCGVLFAHGTFAFILLRKTPSIPVPLDENPVFVTLISPPPKPDIKPPPMVPETKNPAPQTSAVPPKNTAPYQKVRVPPPKTRLQAETVPATKVKPVDGPWIVFAPKPNPASKGAPNTALGSILQSLACTQIDGPEGKSHCPQGPDTLTAGYGDEIKRIAEQADILLYLAAGSPKLRPPEDVSLSVRDPMASINLIGGPVFDLESAKELENLHKYKDPVFGD
jgi:hypothetical protein